MKILAIDSSGMPATVAVLEDGLLTAEYTVHYQRTHSQTLLPMLEEVRTMLELDLSSVDAVAVAGGPGSFTLMFDRSIFEKIYPLMIVGVMLIFGISYYTQTLLEISQTAEESRVALEEVAGRYDESSENRKVIRWRS